MTRIFLEKIHCSVCNTENEYPEIMSTNEFGSSDLDTRPPEMKRSTIYYWVQRCPNCGYCASDVSKISAVAQKVIKSKEYIDQLNDFTYPELSNSFLCKAIIDHDSNNYVAATWAIIHAAWVCDDDEKIEQAKICRQKATDMISTAEDNGQKIAEDEGTSSAILVDLLRRAGSIEKAKKIIEEKRKGISNNIITQVLDFQLILIKMNDLSCYTIENALNIKNKD